MARALVLPITRAQDSSGVIYPGALLDCFLAGTTTPTDVYSDGDRTTPHSNPVVADAGGLFPEIFPDPTVNYRFRLRTTLGVAIPGMDFDPFDALSGADIKFTPAGSGIASRTVQDRLRDMVSVKDKALSGTNIAPALASFIADIGGSAGNLGFGEAFLPRGSYQLASTVLSVSQGFQLRGEGRPAITWTGPAGTGSIATGGGAPITSTSILFRIQDSSAPKLENLILLGGGLQPDIFICSDDANGTNVTSGGNELLHVADVIIGRRWIQNAVASSGVANGGLYGIYFGGPNLSNNDQFSIERCSIHDCTGAGILIASNQSIWANLASVFLDTCGYGIDTRSNTQSRNLCFNRNTIADFRCRDNTQHDILGFNAENSFLLISQDLNASVHVKGGKVLLTNSVVHNGVTVVMGPYWAQFARAHEVKFEDWWIETGTAIGRRLQVNAGTAYRGDIFIRCKRLPGGDTREGYEFNSAASCAGLFYDIQVGAFKAKGTLDGSVWIDPTSLIDGASLLTSHAIALTITGTVATTSGSPVITGTNTVFTDLRPGQQFIVADTAEVLTILSIQSATSMTATSNAANTDASSALRIILNAEGDPVLPALHADLAGMLLTGNVYDNNLLYARLHNETAGTLDLGSMAGTITTTAASTTVTGSGTDFTLLVPGQQIIVTDTIETLTVGVIASATSMTVQTAATGNATGSAFRRKRKLRWRRIADYEIKAKASATFDGANLAAGTGETTTIAIPCALGDFVYWGYTPDLRGSIISAYVSAANVVSVRLQNQQIASATNPASGTLSAYVIKESAFDFMGAKMHDTASLADGAGESITVTVPGARVGDYCLAAFSVDLQGISHSVYISADNTATVRLQNETTGVIDLANMQVRVGAWIALG